jgi:uncharacterized protein YndB with AHSA1/START domain
VTSIEIDRPPTDVFAYATDPMRFPEWQRDVEKAEVVGDPMTVGSTFTTVRRFAGRENRLVQRITEVTEPHRWSTQAVSGPILPDATLSIEPLDGGTRSRVTFTIDYRTSGVGKLILPMVRRQTEQGAPVSFTRLKEILESTTASA